MEAEDFEAAAELSTALDAAARDASTAAGAARDADAGCEAASRRRVEVGNASCLLLSLASTCFCCSSLLAKLPAFMPSSGGRVLKANLLKDSSSAASPAP